MRGVRVFIATTRGPVEVRRITPEHSDVSSAACVEHTDAELPISAAYNSFVRPPTGIIQRYFEHGSFLLELSDRIDVGDSWKLGVFAAHALLYANRLQTGSDEAGQVIWVTGDVQRDLSVPEAGHIEDKLRKSCDLFRDLVARGVSIKIFMPENNLRQLDDVLLRDVGVSRESIVTVSDANNLLDRLALPPLNDRRRGRQPFYRRKQGLAAAVVVLMIIGIAGIVVWYEESPPTTTVDSSTLSSQQLSERLASTEIHGASTNSGGRFMMKLRENGSATIDVQGDNSQPLFSETGEWWAEPGGFCFKFSRFSKGKLRCPRITIEGNRLVAKRGNMQPLDWTFKNVSISPPAEPETARPDGPADKADITRKPASGSVSTDPLMAQFKSNLSTEKIIALLSTNDVEGTSVVTGSRFVMHLGKNHEATVDLNIPNTEAVMHDRGKWWVEDGKYCYKFSRFGNGRRACRYVFEREGEIKFMFLSGLVVDWKIVPAKANKETP